jgi:molybdate transport system substrate-binding protein
VQKLALAGENVPAGIYGDQVLKKLGSFQAVVEARKIVRAQDVRAALAYVEHGEAEAGIVYATDAKAAPGVEVAFQFDPALHEKIVYVLVLVKNHEVSPAARQFYDFIQGADAATVFSERGFVRLDASQASSDEP